MRAVCDLPPDLARLRQEFVVERPPLRAALTRRLVRQTRRLPSIGGWFRWRRRARSPWTAIELGIRVGNAVALLLVRARLEIGRVGR